MGHSWNFPINESFVAIHANRTRVYHLTGMTWISTRCGQGAAKSWHPTKHQHPSAALEDTAHSEAQALAATCCKTCMVFSFRPDFLFLSDVHIALAKHYANAYSTDGQAYIFKCIQATTAIATDHHETQHRLEQ